MRDLVFVICLVAFWASFWGVIRPYKGIARKTFALVLVASCLGAGVTAEPSDKSKRVAALDAAAKDRPSATEESEAQQNVLVKAKAGFASSVPYTKADNKKTFDLVGAKMFARLNELERGAVLVAAASENCDAVTVAAVSLRASKPGAPKWYADCDNGNRFMIDVAAAEKALSLEKAQQLTDTDLPQSCTTGTISECNASPAQKSTKQAEVATFCQMTVQQALISEPDFDWGWRFELGDDDVVRVSQNFTAQNGFGAELKHHYVCDFDATKKEIVKLTIVGPYETKRII